ncbi:hypothetical protein AB0H71_04595 [Nocardia sp. NPDC050697]|uniref:hypothetical protein n=1 Tax=Nocardia sp. NPDC050697 TaxID=3155158 RepID=UPI003402326C
MSTDSLAGDERAELLRLRAEVAALRGRPAAPDAEPPAARPPRTGLRWTAVTILLVLVGVLAFGSVTARFVRGQLLDTDRYLSTVAPLASDPALQADITNQITDEIFARLDVQERTKEALTALTARTDLAANAPRVDAAIVGLAPVITEQAKDFVHETVGSIVRSQQFEDLWLQANRAAHAAVVAVMTGDHRPAAIEVDRSGTVSVSLGTVLERVETALTERGFAFAERLPAVDKQFVLFRSPELVRAQRAVDALDRAAAVLPWLGIGCAAAAVAVAPRGRRLRALSLTGLAIAAGMLVLALSILVGRALYLDSVPPDVLSPGAATAVIDTVLVPLRTSLRAVAVLGLVIALGAFLVGGSSSARAVRRAYGQAQDFVRRPARGREPNAVERWALQLRTPLRCAIVGIAAVLLMFWRYPTGAVVLWIVLGALVALAALELLIRPARIAAHDRSADDLAVTADR